MRDLFFVYLCFVVPREAYSVLCPEVLQTGPGSVLNRYFAPAPCASKLHQHLRGFQILHQCFPTAICAGRKKGQKPKAKDKAPTRNAGFVKGLKSERPSPKKKVVQDDGILGWAELEQEIEEENRQAQEKELEKIEKAAAKASQSQEEKAIRPEKAWELVLGKDGAYYWEGIAGTASVTRASAMVVKAKLTAELASEEAETVASEAAGKAWNAAAKAWRNAAGLIEGVEESGWTVEATQKTAEAAKATAAALAVIGSLPSAFERLVAAGQAWEQTAEAWEEEVEILKEVYGEMQEEETPLKPPLRLLSLGGTIAQSDVMIRPALGVVGLVTGSMVTLAVLTARRDIRPAQSV
eukprot:gnl/MRDRNA2_/MRDRNA2_115568_c0_seq1.p1 gnl/MRDRNA2_/MRDRNA2_115568_c0~~gnl/MRDRNA2_/MRDRNA2_115568_c0_seq1.p1  ORF type:complete len:352 (-),score=93.98 gnl/MRDRNA2_/MRDRNA2_115568_c0_seq1:166-1221(-)